MKISAGIFYKGAQTLRRVVSCALVVALLFMSACSSVKRYDYSYRERDRDYELSVGAKREMTASWYGQEFHGRPTASGEIFNMRNLTCAHKFYPFGTRLRVTNLANGKETECVVNDRGPFIEGRDIDLSYETARKIDLIGAGVGRVRVEILGRDMRYAKYIKYGSFEEGDILTVQAGSFRDASNARKLKEGLDLNYGDVYIVSATVGNEKYYRVRIGRFNTRAEAMRIAGPMANEGYNPVIVRFDK